MTDNQSQSQSPSPSPLLQNLHKKGYLTIPSFLTENELSSLRKATNNLTSLARSNKWPHIRTVGKQFPPWPSTAPSPEEGGIWGVQHLLHPSLPLSPTDRATFIRLYFSPKILDVVHQLLQTQTSPPPTSTPETQDTGENEQELVMELLNLLVRPDREFALVWHRDDIPPSASPEEELSRLTAASLSSSSDKPPKYNHTQWNLPLHNDTSLILIPGSHARTRTPTERDADPYEPNLPGQVTVSLQAGDIAFYDNDILHRGVYKPDIERMTLHGSVSCVGQGVSTKRARNVLQHGVGEWVDGCDFANVLREDREERFKNGELDDDERTKLEEEDEKLVHVAEGMRRRLIQMGRENEGGKNLGFSLSG